MGGVLSVQRVGLVVAIVGGVVEIALALDRGGRDRVTPTLNGGDRVAQALDGALFRLGGVRA